MSNISELAVVASGAQIGSEVQIGPFCVIGPKVTIGDGCKLLNNVTIEGNTHIGRNNVFYPHSVIGVMPQDLKFKGGDTETIFGDGNVIREFCTVHAGTELGGGKTVIGNNNLLMISAHVAHDCILQDKILLGNQTMLAGHVHIEEGAVVSAMIGVHHFVTIGRYSYVGAMTPLRRDAPPFMKISGDPPELHGVNTEGLMRNGFSEADISDLKAAYKLLFRNKKNGKSLEQRLEERQGAAETNGHLDYLYQFLRRSCQSRLFRGQEVHRKDSGEDRRRVSAYEVRAGREQEGQQT